MKKSKEKIQKVKDALEDSKKNGKISDKDYQIKKEKIDKAEKALETFEGNINKAKSIQD